MNCTSIQESLSQWMDGELPSPGEAELFTHLSACEACRTFFKNLHLLSHELSSAPPQQVPPSLDRRVLAVNLSAATWKRRIPWPHPGRTYSIRAIGLAVLLSTIAMGFVSSLLYHDSQPQQTIVCLTPLPEVEVTGYVVVASSPTKGIKQ